MVAVSTDAVLDTPFNAPPHCANISWRCSRGGATFPVQLDFAVEAGAGSAGRAAALRRLGHEAVRAARDFLSGRFGYAENLK